MLVVMTTTSSLGQAGDLAEKIVASKLAACVQILSPMTAVYVWEGKMQKEREHLLLIKTLEEKYDELAALITATHSYDVPEIVAFSADKVSRPYLEWVKQSL